MTQLPPLVSVAIGADAADWRAAIGVVGSALVDAGLAKAAYTDSMIRLVDEHGPYIVIAPGLALCHARPDASVLGDGLAVATLATPVRFGHPYNDPVRVVLGLAVAEVAKHLPFVAALANVFNDPAAVAALIAAESEDDVRAVFAGRG